MCIRDRHNTVDDYPFGGGAGMVLKPEPVYRAIDSIPTFSENKRVILLCPSGATFSQKKAIELSKYCLLYTSFHIMDVQMNACFAINIKLQAAKQR